MALSASTTNDTIAAATSGTDEDLDKKKAQFFEYHNNVWKNVIEGLDGKYTKGNVDFAKTIYDAGVRGAWNVIAKAIIKEQKKTSKKRSREQE